MSLESYKKTLENKREQEQKSSLENKHQSTHHKSPKRKKSSATKIIAVAVLIAVFFLAALKNPSEIEAKTEIKTLFTEKVNEKMRQQVTDEENSAGKQIGSMLAMLVAPTLIDKWIQIDISNYIFFSTVDANIKIHDEKKTIASGVIVFGKVIPLKSDIKKEYFE